MQASLRYFVWGGGQRQATLWFTINGVCLYSVDNGHSLLFPI